MLVELTLVHRMLLDIFGKPFLELLMVVKKLRHNEMKQSPKLGHIILNRGSRKQKPVPSVERQKCFPSPTVAIFDCLSFIKDHIMPLDSLQTKLVFASSNDQVVRSDQDMDAHRWVVQVFRVQKLS